MIIIILVAAIAIVLYMMNLSGELAIFWDPASFTLLLLMALLLAFGTTQKSSIKDAAFILAGKKLAAITRYEQVALFWNNFGNFSLIGGILLSITSWIALSATIENLAIFGDAFSLASLPLCYGIGFRMIGLFLSSNARNKMIS
ncbi:hypothetical protein ACMAZF_19125 [Psychrobium sp. nBUS_13]|uniref:hypothetical protein n=1 Tax=Psychrobium sp. nBUS_13 TaxID=3395319 RepID=UPI003EBACD5E